MKTTIKTISSNQSKDGSQVCCSKPRHPGSGGMMSIPLSEQFSASSQAVTGKRLEALRQDYYIEARMRGLEDASIGGLNINMSGRHESAQVEERKRKQSVDDALLLSLLEDMQQRLAELEARMAERYRVLQEKYGERVVDGMVETYLTDEERAGLKTEEEKMKALASKFLNPDGTIKDEYKNLEEAKYVRDWQEAQKLRPVVAKYEGRNELSAEEQHEVYATAKSVGLAGNKNMIALSDNAAFKATVDKALDHDRSEASSVKTETTLVFGR